MSSKKSKLDPRYPCIRCGREVGQEVINSMIKLLRKRKREPKQPKLCALCLLGAIDATDEET